MNDDKTLNNYITLLGLICTFSVAAIFFFWAKELSNHWAITSSLLLGTAMHLGIWFFTKKFDNYGKSFIAAFVLLFICCSIPYAQFGLFILSIFLAGFFAVDLVKSPPKKIFSIFIFAILFGLVIFGSTSIGLADPFIGEKIRQFSLNPDDLFFISMSTMAKNYDRISTGLHGLPWVHYHFLSAQIYGMISKLLSIEPHNSFGYVNFIVFCPLLITNCFALVAQSISSTKNKWLLVSFVVFGSCLTQTFGSFYGNHFISESFLMGCILMTAGLTVLVAMVRSPKIYFNDLLFLWVLIPFTSIGKISAGFILTGAAMISIAMKNIINFRNRGIIILITGIVGFFGYKLARIVPIPGLEMVFHWKHYQNVFGPPSMLLFLVLMFPYFFLLLPGYIILFCKGKTNRELSTWYLILLFSFIIGFYALNLTIDSSGYYFSALHAFVALPLVGILLSNDDYPKNIFNFKKITDYEQKYLVGLTVLLAAIPVYYFFHLFPKELDGLKKVREAVFENRKYQNKYASLFAEIKKDPDPSMMVYVPKTEIDFWNNQDGSYAFIKSTQCVNMPFYIPILTGKPSLFGLPEPAMQCYVFHRGYEAYSNADYLASAKADYTHEELCEEVLKKKFHGYYRVTNVAEKHLCN